MGLKSRKTVKDCYRHASRRARERYQEFLTVEDLKIMSEKIRKGEAKHLLNESHTRTHWLIDDKFIVVYNKSLHAITTFLPPEAIFNYLGSEVSEVYPP